MKGGKLQNHYKGVIHPINQHRLLVRINHKHSFLKESSEGLMICCVFFAQYCSIFPFVVICNTNSVSLRWSTLTKFGENDFYIYSLFTSQVRSKKLFFLKAAARCACLASGEMVGHLRVSMSH